MKFLSFLTTKAGHATRVHHSLVIPRTPKFLAKEAVGGDVVTFPSQRGRKIPIQNVKKPVNLSCTVRKDSNQGKRKIPYQNQNRVADVEIPDRIHF
jgi:hypothetical protein